MNVTEEKEIPQNPAQPKKRRRVVKKILITLILVFIIMQFFQPDKNNNGGNLSNDITTEVPMPDTVQRLFVLACYNCHSNNTRYPWYSNIQPVGWWLKDHIDEGKSELNFNEFAAYETRKQLKMLKKIKRSIQENWMPLGSYTWMHAEARLNATQKKIIIEWVDNAEAKISSRDNYK